MTDNNLSPHDPLCPPPPPAPGRMRGGFVRGAVLFAALALIKVCMLLSLNKHLFHSHYRLGTQYSPVANWFLAGFVFLLFATFCFFGLKAKTLPVPQVRRLHLWFLVMGACLVFFSLHRMDKNYLYPIVTGVLSWREVGNYLVLDLFFSKPWLAAYVMIYALLYYILFRKKLEWCSFFLLGAMAAVYLGLNLAAGGRHTLLLILICFGAGGWLSYLYAGGKTLDSRFQVLPIIVMAGFWALFLKYAPALSDPGTNFFIVLAVTALLFVPPWFVFRHGSLFPALTHFLPFFWLTFLLLSNSHYPGAGNFNQLFLYSLTFPHYFLGEFLCTAALLGTALALGRLSRPAARWTFDLGAVVLIAAALIDYQTLRTLGVRLEWSLFTMSNKLALAWRTVRPYASQVGLALLIVAANYATAVWLLNRRTALGSLRAPSRSALASLSAICLLLTCIASQVISPDKVEGFALVHLAGSSPFFSSTDVKRFEKRKFIELATRLELMNYFDRPETPHSRTNYPNVFLIVLESTYNRYLSLFGGPDETQPLLKKYQDRMELFPNFYSNFPNSFHARFAVLSGLYPIKNYVSSVNPRIEALSLPEILHAHQYATAVFQSDPRDYTRFGDYVGHRNVDTFHDCDTMPGKEKFKAVSWGVEEAATMEAIKAQFARHAKNQERFFVSYFPVAPHMPFDTPSARFDKFPTGYETFSRKYGGRYKNQLLYIDWILTSLLEGLEELDLLDNTLVAITNDHGEMVEEEDGRLGHGWCVRPDLCNTPLIIMDPRRKGYRVNYTLGSQVDVLPTLLDLLGMDLPAHELYEGRSLYDPAAKEGKTVYFNSQQQRALIRDSHYILEDTTQKQPNGCATTSVFEISHQGTKTIFRPINESTNITSLMDDFERFQESFITHYSYYKGLLSAPVPARTASARTLPPPVNMR